MLKRPDIELTPAVVRMLQGMMRVAKRSWSYAQIGRQIPGQMRAAPRGYVWFLAGKGKNVTHHRMVVRNGQRVHEPYEVQSPYLTLVDVRLTKKQRMERRVSLGLPPHP